MLTKLKIGTVLQYRFLLGISVLSLATIAARAGRRRCSLRDGILAISTHHSRVQNSGRFHIVYIGLQKEKYQWLFVAAALIFSPTYGASCHKLRHQLLQCEPINCVQDEFVFCGAAHQNILQRFLICRVQYAVFSFPSSLFFFSPNFPVRTLYHTNYRKYPRDTFGLRNILFPILRLSHLLDVSVYLSTLSIMKKEKDEHFLSFQDKRELKEVNLEAMQSLACSCRIWKFVRISFDFQ